MAQSGRRFPVADSDAQAWWWPGTQAIAASAFFDDVPAGPKATGAVTALSAAGVSGPVYFANELSAGRASAALTASAVGEDASGGGSVESGAGAATATLTVDGAGAAISAATATATAALTAEATGRATAAADGTATAALTPTATGAYGPSSSPADGTATAALTVTAEGAFGPGIGSGDGAAVAVLSVLGVGVDATPPAEVEQPSKGAGSSRRRRRRTFVEIDGEEFEVASPEQALQLLHQAQQLAEKAAVQAAAEVVRTAIQKARHVGKAAPLSVKAPKVSGPPELRDAVKEANERIERVYRAAVRDAEIAMLMALEEERDDEEVLLLSL